MRLVIATAAAVVAFATTAGAADMAPLPMGGVLRGALPASESPDFAGTYVGGFGGFSQMNFDTRQAGVATVQEMLRATVYLNPGKPTRLSRPGAAHRAKSAMVSSSATIGR